MAVTESGSEDFRFDLILLPAAACTVEVTVRNDDKVRVQQVIAFAHPKAPPQLPSPQDVIPKYIRRINAKGGRVWINHRTSVPRSLARQEAYWAAETNDGDASRAGSEP
jgi:hypothetical protein